MIDKFKNIFAIPELRRRILFTLGVLICVRLGAHIPIPGIDGDVLAVAFQGMENTLFGLYNLCFKISDHSIKCQSAYIPKFSPNSFNS